MCLLKLEYIDLRVFNLYVMNIVKSRWFVLVQTLITRLFYFIGSQKSTPAKICMQTAIFSQR